MDFSRNPLCVKIRLRKQKCRHGDLRTNRKSGCGGRIAVCWALIALPVPWLSSQLRIRSQERAPGTDDPPRGVKKPGPERHYGDSISAIP
jgi:hypothetical protein